MDFTSKLQGLTPESADAIQKFNKFEFISACVERDLICPDAAVIGYLGIMNREQLEQLKDSQDMQVKMIGMLFQARLNDIDKLY